MGNDSIRDRLAEVLTGPLTATGLDIEAIDVTAAGRRRLLRLAVDKDGGVTLDEVAEATREVSRVLDDTDAMGAAPYTLEVSSPGTDRPLTLPRHWRRNHGRLVKLTTHDAETLTGRIIRSNEQSVTLDVEGAERIVDLPGVASAKIQVELNKKGG